MVVVWGLLIPGLCAGAECPSFLTGTQVGTIESSIVDEASGIAASRKNSDVFWVHNDHGDSARVFALTSDGTHLGAYFLSGADDEDYEDIAIGPGPTQGVDYLYVGNIGDNDDNRAWVEVYRVAEPVVEADQSPVYTTLTGVDTIKLQFPSGSHDAEALMVDPVTKDIYIISKDEGISRVYRAPYPQSTTATTTMQYKAQLPWRKASGSDISVEGNMIIVRTETIAAIWLREKDTDLWDAFSGTACYVPLLFENNGEAVCFDANGCGYFTTGEGLYEPIHYFERDINHPQSDIDTDGDVDLGDYAILASQWQQGPGTPSADIAPGCGDGFVDTEDLALLVANWLWEEP